jgi:hypothetical protein
MPGPGPASGEYRDAGAVAERLQELQLNGVTISRQGLRAAAVGAIALCAGTTSACSGYTANAAPSEQAAPASDNHPVGTEGPSARTVQAITSSGMPPLPPMGQYVPAGAPTRAAQTASAGARRGVAVFGDSLVLQSWTYLQRIASDRHQPFAGGAYGGTALCDWMSAIRTALTRDRPAALVLAFAGNNLTPCTLTRSGQRRFGAALVRRYHADALRAVAAARRAHTKVFVVGPPAMHDPRWNDHATRLRRMLLTVATHHADVAYLDAHAVLSPDGYRATSPCRSFETAALGCHGGTIAVRDADGVHLSPPVGGDGGYSAGGWRFATLLLRGIPNAGP